jgi:hypothetical protein
MMDEAGQRLPGCDRFFQCGYSQATSQAAPQRPTHYLARKSVENYGQIDKLGFQANVGDIRHPQLINPG